MLHAYLLLLWLTASASLICQEQIAPSQNATHSPAVPSCAENQTIRVTVSVTTQGNTVDGLATPEQKVVFVPRGQLTDNDKKADLDYCRKVLSDPNTDVNSVIPSGIPVLEFLSILYLNNLPVEGAILQLLARGADVNTMSSNTKTPLYYLTCYTVCPEFFEKIQGEKSTKTVAEDKVEKTAQSKIEEDDAQNLSITLRDRETNLQVMELLLYFGANPLIGDENGVTPVHLALSKKDEDALNLFVKYGWIQLVEDHEQDATQQESATSEEQSATV